MLANLIIKTFQISNEIYDVEETSRLLLEQFLEDQGEAEHVDEIDMGKALSFGPSFVQNAIDLMLKIDNVSK